MERAEKKYRCLNRDVIKYIAMFTMLLNHIATIFMVPGSWIREIFVALGYFTAPSMIYFLIEGYDYTHSKKAYLKRLFIFGLISEIPFCMAFSQGQGIEFEGLNMLFTLCLCFGIIWIEKEMENKRNRVLFITGIILLSTFCDWAIFAPVFTLIFLHGKKDKEHMKKSFLKAALLFGVINFMGEWGRIPFGKNMIYAGMSMCGIFLAGICILFCYNGKRAEKGKTFSKWFFYLFYPVHLLVLGLLRIQLM